MTPKSAIKMINIQKSYLVHIGLNQSILPSLVHFSPIGSIRSTLVIFNPYVHFGPNLSIRSRSVYFDPIQFTLFPFGLLRSIWSICVHFGPFVSIFMHLHTRKRYVWWVESTYSKSKFIKKNRRKCTFSPYILTFFHFGPYILILPLLVPKPINACYFRPFHQSTDKNS